MWRAIAAATGVALLAGGLIGAAAAQEIGVAAAVNPDAVSTLPNQERRMLVVGTNVFHREHVVTSERGQTQMLFIDESALTIGPNSDMVLDEFVYDPNQETGKLVISATKGVFRLVGGKISKKETVLIKTPTATIGIRGGIALISIVSTGDVGGQVIVRATLLFGDSMTMTAGGVTKETTKTGYMMIAETSDQPPSDPEPAPQAVLAESLGAFESAEGESGGLEEAPSEESVAEGMIGVGSEDEAPADMAPDVDGAGSGEESAESTMLLFAEGEEMADQAADVADALQDIAIEELEELNEVLASADSSSMSGAISEVSEVVVSPSGFFNNRGLPITNFTAIRSIPTGLAVFKATGLSLIDSTGIRSIGSGSSIIVFDQAVQPVLGTFDVVFKINFDAVRFFSEFSHITIPSLRVTDAFLAKEAALPIDGPTNGDRAFISFVAATAGAQGVSADPQCISIKCVSHIDILGVVGQPPDAAAAMLEITFSNSNLVGTGLVPQTQ